MDKLGLEETIARLEKQELNQKFGLENDFRNMEEQMKPGKILQNIIKRGVLKVRSFLPKFSSQSNSRR